MEKLVCTLLILCSVLVDLRVCSGEDDVTSMKEYRLRPTPRTGLTLIDYTPVEPLDLFKLARHAISRRSKYESNFASFT